MDGRDQFNEWTPLPPGYIYHERRVITRAAYADTYAWFPVPDPNGYAGIGLALMSKIGGPREFWVWTDESAKRTARVVRLGYRRYVVELNSACARAIVENPKIGGTEDRVTDAERDVLGRTAVSSAHLFTSSVIAESCVSLWLNHELVHDGYVRQPWVDR